MKKHLSILVLIILCSSSVAIGQEKTPKLRNKYRNISFITQEYTPSNGVAIQSDYGAAFTTGRTYYLHKRPIGGVLRFGIDATWFDINYINYKIDNDNIKSILRDESEDNSTIQLHQADISMHIGASLSINPVDKLNIHCYFRYAPTLSAQYIEESLYYGYVSNFVTGAAISYGVIGLGAEYRFGKGKLTPLEVSDGENQCGNSEFSGMRFYLSFRF